MAIRSAPAAGSLERRRERVAACALAVDADGQARHLTQLGDELGGPVRLQERRGIVQQDPRRAELRQAASRVDERLVLAAPVEEPGFELAPRRDDRLGGVAQVVDVVQRVVQAEDVDAALGGAGHEPPGEVAVHRARADEEAPANGKGQRGLGASLESPDALPWALDAPAHGRVEDAAARDLEVRKAGPVQDLRDLEEVRRRHEPCERLL